MRPQFPGKQIRIPSRCGQWLPLISLVLAGHLQAARTTVSPPLDIRTQSGALIPGLYGPTVFLCDLRVNLVNLSSIAQPVVMKLTNFTLAHTIGGPEPSVLSPSVWNSNLTQNKVLPDQSLRKVINSKSSHVEFWRTLCRPFKTVEGCSVSQSFSIPTPYTDFTVANLHSSFPNSPYPVTTSVNDALTHAAGYLRFQVSLEVESDRGALSGSVSYECSLFNAPAGAFTKETFLFNGGRPF